MSNNGVSITSPTKPGANYSSTQPHEASRTLDVEDIYSITTVSDPDISPDGRFAVYVAGKADRTMDRTVTRLRIVATDNPDSSRPLTNGETDQSPQFSPDGGSVVFTRAAGGVRQIFVISISGGEARQVTHAEDVPDGAGAPVISPDGGRAVFAAMVNRTDRAAHDAVVVDDRDYKLDGHGTVGSARSHLYVTDLDCGSTRQVTDGDWHASSPAWAPDGSSLAFIESGRTRGALGEESRLQVIAVDDPLAKQKTIGDARSVGGPIRWNPDGSKLLAIGNLEPGVSISRLIEVDVGTGFTRVLTDDVDLNIMPGATAYPGGAPRYVGDDRQVMFCLRSGGQTKLCSIDTFSGLLRQYELAEDQVVAGLAVAPRGDRAVVVLGDSQYFGELVAVDLDSGESTMLTHFQQSDLPDVALIPRRARQFEISDGTMVHGWILRDPKTTGAGPLLLDIHGGPHNAWTGAADAVHLYHHVLAAKGWTILTLNPRGSDGYGNDFLTAVVGGWGVTDENDFLEPIDELIADGLVDSTALAVTGYSYGGFATCYLTARTRRFAAAIAGGLVCDLPAMAASSDEGEEMDKVEFGVSRERLWELSPLANAAMVDTPTLVMHGEADVRCPVEQAEHWFASLRSAGTAARMVTYPGSSHLFVLTGRPSHRSDYNRRLIDWAERFVVGTGARGASALPAPPDRKYWQRKLRQSAARFHVPGAQLGFIELDQDGNMLTETVVTAGVVNNVSREAVSGDSLFEIGSITKIWTTVLIMQLVEEGRLDLDSPVREVLPDLILADEQVASTVTTRDLLCHRSGIDGDVFTPTSRNDDAVRRYVELLGSARQVHPRGNGFSYCNAGFVIAGRIVEVLRGEPWDRVVRDRLIHPLRLAHTLTGPDPWTPYSSAVGHIDHDGVWEPAVDGAMPRSVGPAANVTASAHDVLVFASMFLRKGVGPDGAGVMSPESVDTMRTHHVDLPARTETVSGWGAGWMLENWAGVDVYGHNGATVGQNAFLRIFPEERIAVVLLTNGGMPTGMYRELFSDVTSTIAGVELPHWFEPPVDGQPHTDLTPYVGTYCSAGTDVEISLCDSKLIAIITSKLGLIDETESPETWTLHPVRPHVFAGRQRLGEEWGELRFLADDEGNEYLQFGLRRLPKLAN